MGKVWVNGKVLDSLNKKSEKWTPAPKPEKTVWGKCPDCNSDIMNGETVWWMHDRKVCWDCREPYRAQGIGHMDCCDLEFPELTLSH